MIKLRQTNYIENILQRYRLHDAATVRTPMAPGQVLKSLENPTEEELKYMKNIPYMNMVGALRYAADCTRPDIAFATGQFAQHLTKPSIEHFNAVKHCFKYLKGTKDYWLILGGTESTELIGYTDADGMTQEGHKAISGYVFQLGESTISWSSKKQELVSLSVCEAELQALTHGVKEALWLRRLVEELFELQPATKINCDNQAAITIVNSTEQRYTQRTKHIDIQKDFLKDYIEKS